MSHLASFYEGQRLSLKNLTCTVRFVGSVAGKAGEWLGVEWDDTSRGKNNGTFDGVRYFSCRSSSATAASFLRPSQPWDEPRTFFQAVRDKYVANEGASRAEVVYLSGKQAEEVGFGKFAKRQAKLKGIHVLVLDRMQVHGRQRPENELDVETAHMCAKVTDLDLSSNLLESVEEIQNICSKLPELQRLTLDGDRILHAVPLRLSRLKSLSISNLFSQWHECSRLLEGCDSLKILTAAESGFTKVEDELPPLVSELDLAGNQMISLSQLIGPAKSQTLTKLVLKHNKISDTGANQQPFHSELADLDLSYNQINTWSFFDQLPLILPSVRHLRVTGNPLYLNLRSAEGKPLSTEDGYMLTIARLPQLQSLNYSKITDKERLNADTYYLSQIATEMSLTPPENEAEIASRHPRWQALVKEYGEPVVVRKLGADEIDPNSLAARLVRCKFSLVDEAQSIPHADYWEEEIPKSFDVYKLLGLVGKRLDLSPRCLRLTWVTGEKDPLAQKDDLQGPEWWDSDDENEAIPEEDELVSREVEIVPGTRAIGTYFEAGEVAIRVSLKERSCP
ncbi:hypothetical protein MBLNU230_g6615t1 [Neophaeotheca triangularis]